MKTILAPLAGSSSDRTVLDAAIATAKISGGHVKCFHARVDPMEAAALYGAIAPHRLDNVQKIIQEIHDEEQEKSRRAKTAFQDACERHALTVSEDPERGGVSVSWQEESAGFDGVLHNARFHDLVVMSRDAGLPSSQMKSVLMKSGRPLLIAPPKPTEIIGRRVAIAWKEGPETAHALTAASSFLSQADHVAVICVSEDMAGDDADRNSAECLAKQLRWYGQKADVRMNYERTGSPGAKIREMAYEYDSDLLVMGAYGHNRLQEYIFGGVTREILSECAIPVLMHR